jgi:hypothetical protein
VDHGDFDEVGRSPDAPQLRNVLCLSVFNPLRTWIDFMALPPSRRLSGSTKSRVSDDRSMLYAGPFSFFGFTAQAGTTLPCRKISGISGPERISEGKTTLSTRLQDLENHMSDMSERFEV